jgi:hypothetical protein
MRCLRLSDSALADEDETTYEGRQYELDKLKEKRAGRQQEMEKGKFWKWLTKPLFVSFLAGAVILGMYLLLFCPYYESDLDLVMQSLVYSSRFSGVGTSRLIFSNIFLGKFFSICMLISSNLPWYAVFHYCMIFLAIWILLYITMQRNPNKMGMVMGVVTALFYGYECYVVVNYMKTAAVLCIAALYLLVYQMEQETYQIHLAVLIIFCAVMSSFVSFTTFAWIGGIGLIGIVIYRVSRKQMVKWMGMSWVSLVIVVVLSVGFRVVDTQFYKTGDGTLQLAEYRNSIERVYNCGYPEYSDELGEKYGIEEAEYSLLVNGFYPRTEESSMELLKALSGEHKTWSISEVKSFFRSKPLKLFQIGMFYCWVVLLILMWQTENPRKRRMLLASVVMMFLAYLGLYMGNALGSGQIVPILFFVICFYALMPLQGMKTADVRDVCVWLGVLAVVLYSKFSAVLPTVNRNDNNAQVLYARQNPSETFILGDGAATVSVGGLPDNLLFWGGASGRQQLMDISLHAINLGSAVSMLVDQNELRVLVAYNADAWTCAQSAILLNNSLKAYGATDIRLADIIDGTYCVYEYDFDGSLRDYTGFYSIGEYEFYYVDGQRQTGEFEVDGTYYETGNDGYVVSDGMYVDTEGYIAYSPF